MQPLARDAPWIAVALRVCCCLAVAVLVTGCVRAGDAAPVVEIGVIAPFEGLGRPLGYAVLPAVQEVLSEANSKGAPDSAIGGVAGFQVALVALNDDLYGPTALAQAEALAQHDNLVGAMGLWSDEAATAAMPALRAAGIPVLVPIPLGNGVPGVYSLCPPLADVVAALVERAAQLGEAPIILAGAPGPLADSLRAAGSIRELGAEGPLWVDCVRATSLREAEDDGRAGLPEPAGPTPPVSECADLCAQDTGLCRATVLYTGSAASAADDLVRWRAAGWQGAFVGGPELARPWLVDRAGDAAERVEAVVCAEPPGEIRADDRSLDVEALVARAGAQALLRAIARDVAIHRVPTRAGVGDQLRSEVPAGSLAWLRVRDGRWVAGASPP